MAVFLAKGFPPMTVRLDVAVVGEIYVDHIFSGFPAWPLPGEEVTTEAYTREMGGGTIATACGLARLGARSAWSA
jgi:sugar/nucleoside kinase (ribokinase family)